MRHTPTKHLNPRLKKLWDFLRLQLHLHYEPTSRIGAHCLGLKLGSLAEPRFNRCCTHDIFAEAATRCPVISETCQHDGCTVDSKHHCKFCATSYCTVHLALNICTAEHLPTDFGEDFVCPQCSPHVESRCHVKEGCATCDEVEYFKLDLRKVAKATGVADIIGRAEDLCTNIDIMVGHIARVTNQVT